MMGRMTTSTLAAGRRPTLLDRIAHWALDTDGDMYGDERERLRWYEGIATAASLQWMAIPWAAALMVWIIGRSAVPPLTVIMVVLLVPIGMASVYVKRRRVDTDVKEWTRKRVVVSVLNGLPWVLFIAGSLHAFDDGATNTLPGMAVGAVVGGVLGGVAGVVGKRRRKARETSAAALDVD
jgi:membrane associated rhomboid family serine protease